MGFSSGHSDILSIPKYYKSQHHFCLCPVLMATSLLLGDSENNLAAFNVLQTFLQHYR